MNTKYQLQLATMTNIPGDVEEIFTIIVSANEERKEVVTIEELKYRVQTHTELKYYILLPSTPPATQEGEDVSKENEVLKGIIRQAMFDAWVAGLERMDYLENGWPGRDAPPDKFEFINPYIESLSALPSTTENRWSVHFNSEEEMNEWLRYDYNRKNKPSGIEKEEETVLELFASDAYRSKIMATNPDDSDKIIASFFLHTFAQQITEQEARNISDQISLSENLGPEEKNTSVTEGKEDKPIMEMVADLIREENKMPKDATGQIVKIGDKVKGEGFITFQDGFKIDRSPVVEVTIQNDVLYFGQLSAKSFPKFWIVSPFVPSTIPVVDYEKEAERVSPYFDGLDRGIIDQRRRIWVDGTKFARQMPSPSDQKEITVEEAQELARKSYPDDMMDHGTPVGQINALRYGYVTGLTNRHTPRITPSDTNCKEVQFEFLFNKYQEWCKLTHRNGAVLIGSSIKEFFKWVSEEKANSLIQQK